MYPSPWKPEIQVHLAVSLVSVFLTVQWEPTELQLVLLRMESQGSGYGGTVCFLLLLHREKGKGEELKCNHQCE